MASIYQDKAGRSVYDNNGQTFDAKTGAVLGDAPASQTPPAATPPAVNTGTPATPPVQQTQDQMTKAFADSGQKPYSTPVPSAAPVTTSDLARGTTLPDPAAFVGTSKTGVLSDMVTKVAGTTLDSTGKAIDSLLAQREADQAAQKDTAQGNVNADRSQIATLGANESTANQDALAATRAKFNVDQTISDLRTIQSKITAAQEALDMGLIYEQDRPVREQLILGRTASLQKQGLATIGALQSTAQILQGNIDLAESYAKTTIDAINTDNKNAMDALTTLLSLDESGLSKLSADEKATVDSRIAALQAQDKQLQSNKDDVFKLMSDYPTAALSGGVTLLDDRTTALKKMLPKMSSIEQQKLQHELASNTNTNKDGPAKDKQQLLQLKANGMTYEEAINAFSDSLTIDWINAVYGKADPKSVGGKDQVLNSYYSQFLDGNGNVKPGYTVSVDSKGKPTVVKAGSGDSKWWNPFTW